MKNHIKETLSKNFKIKITPSKLKELIHIVTKFEIRGEHPLALNTPLIGINQLIFIELDNVILFDLFDKSKKELNKLIKDIPTINNDFLVISNPFNIYISWLLHNIAISNIGNNLKYEAGLSLLNYFQYRFLSSIIKHYYPYKANEDIMRIVIDNLNMKFDIIKYKTWKNVIANRSMTILEKSSIHYNTLAKYNLDDDILYFITDTQTRIRNQIKIISAIFHDYKEKEKYIKTYTIMADVDGKKIMKDTHYLFDSISSKVFSQCVFNNTFIVEKYIKLLSKMFKFVSTSMIRSLLIKLTEIAKEQASDNEENKTIKKNGEEITIGLKKLFDDILLTTFNYMIRKNMNLNNKLLILETARKMFSYSRIANNEIQQIKDSIQYLLKQIKLSNRQSTTSSLGIIIILYIILKSFDYLKKH